VHSCHLCVDLRRPLGAFGPSPLGHRCTPDPPPWAQSVNPSRSPLSSEKTNPDPMVSLPSPDEVEEARTPAGGWTKDQLAQWGVPWPPPRGWKKKLEKMWAWRNLR